MIERIAVRFCVSALLIDQQGKVVIQLRDDKPNLLFPAHWATLGGEIEAGETPDEAIHRELAEEISPTPEVKFWRYFEHYFQVNSEKRMVANHVYVGKLPCDLVQIALFEGQRLEAFARHELEALPIAFGLEVILKAFFDTAEKHTKENL